jgi:hypothetical protein
MESSHQVAPGQALFPLPMRLFVRSVITDLSASPVGFAQLK